MGPFGIPGNAEEFQEFQEIQTKNQGVSLVPPSSHASSHKCKWQTELIRGAMGGSMQDVRASISTERHAGCLRTAM